MVGRAAYFWGYPLVATSNRRVAFSKAPERISSAGPFQWPRLATTRC